MFNWNVKIESWLTSENILILGGNYEQLLHKLFSRSVSEANN